jgi:hypothetical protein
MTTVGALRDRDGDLNVNGRSLAGGRHPDGPLLERSRERAQGSGWHPLLLEGRAPRHPNAPQLEGTGEISVETADRATGFWTTRSDREPRLNARTSGVYLRADPSDLQVLDGGSEEERAQLHAQRLQEWKSAANAF